MERLTATFLRESGIEDCPMIEGEALQDYKDLVHRSSDFSLMIQDWMDQRDPAGQVAWLKTSMQAGRELFRPWAMETLYAIAVLDTARFSQLEALLGLSSKTLAAKLKTLQIAGFLERQVFDETPVRIEYRLTKAGRTTAALASPLFTHLNIVKNAGLQSL